MTSLRGVALAIALTATHPALAGEQTCQSGMTWYDPLDLYGNELLFRVLRDGDEVGFHRVAFRPTGDDSLIVESEFLLEVKVLFFTAYRYRYTSTDVWRHGCLVSVDAMVDENGNQSFVRAGAEDQRLTIVGPSGVETADAGIYPTNHWHAGVIGAERVLNTITGKVAEVRIVDDGVDWVMVNDGTYPVRRYHYTGDLRNTVWYDDDGRWVKMRFTAEDGSTIEYVCAQCRPVPSRGPA
jgi:hypothetical protein